MTIQLVMLLHEEMKFLTLKAGVTEEVYNSIIRGDLDGEDIAGLYGWLKGIREIQFQNAFAIWDLHPISRWTLFETLEEHGLTEMKLLKIALIKLKQAWKKPFKVKKKC